MSGPENRHIPPSAELRDESLNRATRLAEGLYPHQIEGIAFMLARRRSILADDMGLGKTRQSILAITESEPVGPYLVVCPAAVKRNWKREIAMVQPGAKCVIVGPGQPPEPGWKDWVVINYDLLGKHLDALEQHTWAGLVFDEAHYLKNHRSKRSQHANHLIKAVGTDPVIHALTGTPLTSRPRDLFPLLQLVKHPMGKSFLTFARRYCDAYKGEYGWVADGASNLDELAVQLHGTMIRRNKDEVLDLPPKVRTWLDVDVPPGTAKQIRGVLQALLSSSRGNRDSPKPDMSDEERRQQQARQGRLLGGLVTARRQLATAKVRSTWNFVEGILDQGEKAIVFSCFKEPIQRLAEHFTDNAVVIDGDTPANERQTVADQFQEDDDTRLLIANIVAGGIGLNLTAARQVVFNDLDWVPANHWQAEDRACRIGQTHAVNVTYMVGAGTIDEFVRAVLETKAHLIDQLVEGKVLSSSLNADVMGELKEILRAIGPQIGNLSDEDLNEEVFLSLIRKATDGYRDANSDLVQNLSPRAVPYSAAAVAALAKALSGPARDKYRIESSKKGQYYTLEVDGPDVLCDCPGFSYRGACKHVRPLKDALVSGEPIPPDYERVS